MWPAHAKELGQQPMRTFGVEAYSVLAGAEDQEAEAHVHPLGSFPGLNAAGSVLGLS